MSERFSKKFEGVLRELVKSPDVDYIMRDFLETRAYTDDCINISASQTKCGYELDIVFDVESDIIDVLDKNVWYPYSKKHMIPNDAKAVICYGTTEPHYVVLQNSVSDIKELPENTIRFMIIN